MYTIQQTEQSSADEEKVSHQCSKFFKFKNQFFATIVISLSGFATGTVAGYTSPTMDALQKRFTLTEQEISLVISIATMVAIPTGFVGGALANFFGRKFAVMLNCGMNAIGWLVLICAQNVYMLYAGRVLTGFAAAVAALYVTVYATEIASPEIRGLLGSSFQLSLCFGVLYSYIIGAYVSWQYLALASLAVPTIQILLMTLIPETPVWLAQHNSQKDAIAALTWLNRSTEDIKEYRLGEPQPTSESQVTLKSFLEPRLLKPLCILLTLMFLQQFSGVSAVVLYAVSIFQSATEAVDPHMSAIIIACSMLLACMVSSVLVDKLGRKLLLIVSSIFMAVGMISVASFYYVQSRDATSVQNVLWLPVVSLVVSEFAYGIGFGPVPWLMMGEVFPDRARGLASGIVSTFAWTTAFTMAKTFPDMRSTMKDYGAFWFFSAVCVFAVFFSFFVVPETKGKTIDEIELHFRGVKRSETDEKF